MIINKYIFLFMVFLVVVMTTSQVKSYDTEEITLIGIKMNGGSEDNFKKALKKGNPYASDSDIDEYMENIFGKKDIYDNKKEYLEEEANKGDIDAYIELGYLCIEGYPWVNKSGYVIFNDFDEGVKWFEKAAERGDSRGYEGLFFIYSGEYSSGTNKDIKKAIEIYEEGMKKTPCSYMAYELGEIFYKESTVKDVQKAVKWYEKAIEMGNDDAKFIMANMYIEGKEIEQDYKKASKLLDSIKYSKYKNSALLHLSKLYEFGNGVQKDIQLAKKYYFEAVNKIDERWGENIKSRIDAAVYAEATYRIGLMFYKGNGVEKNYHKAKGWYAKAAKYQYIPALYALGEMTEEGLGIRQDIEAAKEWYGKVCDNGDQKGCDEYKRLNSKWRFW